jgi:CPA1 family monovalent cation:H+ antiporter
VNAVEIVLLLLATSAVLVIIAERVRLPYPILLVLGGIALAFMPRPPELGLPPHLVLVLFLPPLLFSAAASMSWRDFATHLRTIGLLAVGLVLVTTTCVAVVAHALIPDLPWAVAFVLGAIVSPPDAVAATSVLQRLHVPARLLTVLEGESLINDATGLVAYQMALALAVGGETFSAPHAVLRFAVVGAGGVAFGFAVGWLMVKVHRNLDDFLVETTISILTPYLAYLPAEHLGLSGVLAAVSAGGYLGWRNPQMFSPMTRLRSASTTSVMLFLLNSLVFIIIGLELAGAHRLIKSMSTTGLVGWCAAIVATTIGVRVLWVIVAMRLRSRSGHGALRSWKDATLVGWTSMRGIVSVALALALPETLPDGTPFPMRDALLVIVFSVIAVTLLGQGLSLPFVIRLLGFEEDATQLRQEQQAKLQATERALDRLAELDRSSHATKPLLVRLRASYESRRDRLRRLLQDEREGRRQDTEQRVYLHLRQALIDAERATFVELRDGGAIPEQVLERLQRDLDVESIRAPR